MWFALQDSVQQQFYPTTLLGWLSVLGVLLGTVATSVISVWKLLMKPMVDRIIALGDNVRAAATTSQTFIGKVDLLDRACERLTNDNVRLHEKVGSASTAADNLRQGQQEMERRLLIELGAIRERVVATETKLDAINAFIGGRRQTDS